MFDLTYLKTCSRFDVCRQRSTEFSAHFNTRLQKSKTFLFGSEYGAKVNIFKWMNYPLLWVESRILILFCQLLCKFAGENYKCIFGKKIHSGHHARFWIVSELEVISSKSISNICWIWSFGQLFGLAVPMSSLHSALIGKSTGNGGLGNYSKLIRSIFL